ncbi:hypothetical protein HK101_002924 [Irineochytrium annulatum]|nr:hypothetical protein HK101_002924 [Irineochytrium annulatum]
MVAVQASPLENITDISSFDSFMEAKMAAYPDFVSSFQERFGCPGFRGENIRYERSVYCNYMVVRSLSNCAHVNTKPYTPLCQSSCLDYIFSFATAFMTSSICSYTVDPYILANRTSFITPGYDPTTSNVVYAYCDMLKTNDTSSCSRGLPSEVKDLGYTATVTATLACQRSNMTLDPACPAIIEEYQQRFVQWLHPLSLTPFAISAAGQVLIIVIYCMFVGLITATRWSRATAIAFAFPQPPLMLLDDENSDPRAAYLAELGRHRQTIARGTATTIRRSHGLFPPRGSQDDDPHAPRRGSISDRLGASIRNSAFFLSTPLATARRLSAARPKSCIAKKWEPTRPRAVHHLPRPDSSNPVVRMQAVEAYPARVSDDLALARGDVVVVEEVFDKRWIIARNETTGRCGAVPISCLGPLGEVLEEEGGGDGRPMSCPASPEAYPPGEFNGIDSVLVDTWRRFVQPRIDKEKEGKVIPRESFEVTIEKEKAGKEKEKAGKDVPRKSFEGKVEKLKDTDLMSLDVEAERDRVGDLVPRNSLDVRNEMDDGRVFDPQKSFDVKVDMEMEADVVSPTSYEVKVEKELTVGVASRNSVYVKVQKPTEPQFLVCKNHEVADVITRSSFEGQI